MQVAKWGVNTAVALQDKKSRLAIQLAHGLNSRLSQVVKSRGQVVSQLYFEKLTLRIPFSHKYKYLLYPRNVESFQSEFWEGNPCEKQD